MRRDHPLQFGLKLWCVDRLLAAVGIHARHVLPDQQPELITPVIPALRLDLDVLTGAVETEPQRFRDVEAQCLIRGCGVNSVGPESLIQWADLEHCLAIEHYPGDAVFVLAQRDFPHSEVAGHCVHDLSFRHQRNL